MPKMIRPNLVTLVIAIVVVLCAGTPAFAAKGGGRVTCTAKAPSVYVENNWQWASSGSWGLPGQQLTYALDVVNNDVGCGSSGFVVIVSAPGGFSVSTPTTAITLKSSSGGTVSTNVTSPTVIADGDYPLTVSVQRTTGTATATGNAATVYKVYSSDTAAPTLFWPNPADGTTISGNSNNFIVSSNDDHVPQKMDLSIDNVAVASTVCDDVTYTCQISYSWSTHGAGQHSATFRSYDWAGNVGQLTVTFTVS